MASIDYSKLGTDASGFFGGVAPTGFSVMGSNSMIPLMPTATTVVTPQNPVPPTNSAVTTSNAARDTTTSNKALIDQLTATRNQLQQQLATAKQAKSDADYQRELETAKLESSKEPPPISRDSSSTEATYYKKNADGSYSSVVVGDPAINRDLVASLTAQGYSTSQSSSPTSTTSGPAQPDFKSAQDALDLEAQTIQTEYDRIFSGTSPAEQAMIQSIKDSYAVRKAQQEQVNKAILGNVQKAGFRSGRARYASELQDQILTAEESAGIRRLTELDAEEQLKISEAKAAWESGEWKRFNEKTSLLQNTRAKKNELIQKQYENSIRQEELALAKSAEARASLKDASTIKGNELDYQTKFSENVAPSLFKSLQGLSPEQQKALIDKQARAYGIDPELLQGGIEKYQDDRIKKVQDAILKSTGEYPDAGVTQEEVMGGNIESVMQKVTNSASYARKGALERAQIDKMLADAAAARVELSGGAGAGDSTVMALANEWATRGVKPTGLTGKHMNLIGPVSQAALEIAKTFPAGTVVDSTTGFVKLLPAEAKNRVDGATTLLDQIPMMRALLKDVYTGPLAGPVYTAGKWTGVTADKVEQFNTLAKLMGSAFIQSRSGMAASDTERELLMSTLPQVGQYGKYNEARLKTFEDALKISVNKSLTSMQAKLKDVDLRTSAQIAKDNKSLEEFDQ